MLIDIPSLRERRGDVPWSLHYSVPVACARYQGEPPPPVPGQLRRWMQAVWRGQVREFRKAAQRNVLPGEAYSHDIERRLGGESKSPTITFSEQLECFDREPIEQHLEANIDTIEGTTSAFEQPREILHETPKKDLFYKYQ